MVFWFLIFASYPQPFFPVSDALLASSFSFPRERFFFVHAKSYPLHLQMVVILQPALGRPNMLPVTIFTAMMFIGGGLSYVNRMQKLPSKSSYFLPF